MQTISSRLLALALALSAATSGRGEPPATSDLVQRLPEQTNAVVVVQVREIINSPYGSRTGWGKLDRTVYLAGTVPINPAIERLAVGTQIDPQRLGQSWSYGLLAMNKSVDLDKLAATHKGTIEEVDGKKVAVVAPYGFVVKLQDDLLATASAVEHQSFARWLRFASSPERKPAVARYLADAASRHAQSHLLIAIDAQDLIAPGAARAALVASKLLADDAAALEKCGKFLDKLRGLRLTVRLDKEIRATAYFDSTEPATKELAALRPVFVYLLERAGAELVDLRAAAVRTDAGTVIMEFKLSDDELARILAVFSSPIVHPDPDEASRVTLVAGGIDVEATRRYYQAVNAQLESLRRRTANATDYAKTALWHDTAAKTIESTSILNVDKDVVAFAADVALKLRAIADSLRGVPISLAQLESMKALYVIGGPPVIYRWERRAVAYPNVAVNTNIPQVEARQLEAVRKDADNRQKLWDSLDAERLALRTKLAERYKIDFDAPGK